MNKVYYLLAFISIMSLSACDYRFDTDSCLSQRDTIAILQTALNDSSLIAEAALYLPGQSLKLIRNKVVKPNYTLTFNQHAVRLITIRKEGTEVRKAYPEQFIVSFPLFKAIHKDTVILSMITHSENATDLYKINRSKGGRWHILSDQRGKF